MRGRREEELSSHLSTANGLGIAIRAWSRYRGMSVTELAMRAGFGKSGRGYISRLERGQIRHPHEDNLDNIAAALYLSSADLHQHRMPETHREVPARDLEEAIIGAKALLALRTEPSLELALLHVRLAKLLYERAVTSSLIAVQYAALTEASDTVGHALRVLAEQTTSPGYQEATRLDQDINELLKALIVAGCQAFVKRYPPQSLEWARVQVLLAKRYEECATFLQDQAARDVLTRALQCIEAALPVFTREQAQQSWEEANVLYQAIAQTIAQIDRLARTVGTMDASAADTGTEGGVRHREADLMSTNDQLT
jgi:transcriptional regulator with XRE-family HTH domain